MKYIKIIFLTSFIFLIFASFKFAEAQCVPATSVTEVRGSCAVNGTTGQVCNVSGNPGDCYVQGNNVICNTYSTCDYTTYVCDRIYNSGTGLCEIGSNCTSSTVNETRLCQNISGAKITCNSPPNSIACPSNDPCTTYACVGSGANAFCSPTATGACSGGGGGNCGDTICAGAPFETSSSCPQDCGGVGPTCPVDQQLSIYIPNDGQTTAQGSAITYTVNIGTQDFGDNQYPFTISAVCPIGALCAWEAQALTSGTVTKADATAGTGLVTQPHYLTVRPQFGTTAGSYAVSITARMNNNTVCTASTAANLTVTNGPTFVPSLWIDSYSTGQPQTVSGQIQLFGWALDNSTQPETAISNVRIYVDSVLAGTANYGTNRADVCAVYPDRVGCPYVGWFYYLNTGSYGNGVRNISAVAQDAQGQQNSFSINVNIQNPVTVNGTCGSANKTYLNTDTSYGTDTYCTSGTPSSSPAFPSVGASVTWTCNGSNGGSNSGTCTAARAAATINGACGTSNGGTFTAAPSSSLCNAGNATAVSGSGPWTWSCNSPNGGSNASCSANRAPALTFSPSSYSLTAAAGASVNGSNLTITNSAPAGASNLTWAVSVTTNSGGAWLTASRAFVGQTQSGTEVPGGSATPAISVTANAASLSAGTYTGTITLTSNDPTKLSNSIPVTFVVTASGNPNLSYSPNSFSFNTTVGSNPANQTLNISNLAGAGANLTWTVSVTSGGSWLSANRAGGPSGTEVPGGSAGPPITVSASASSLSAGTYNGNIRLTSNDPTKLTNNIPVTLIVNSPYATCSGTGTIRRDYWTGISGNSVINLTGNANYPNSPSGSTNHNLFEAPADWADDYGQRMYGLVMAPVTGAYTFYVASDDSSELWLSTTSNPANKVRIAYLSGWAPSRSWSVSGTQQSAPVNLVQGQNYYIEVIQKEGGGGDNLAVGWIIPSSSVIDVIPGVCLSPYTPPSCPSGSVILGSSNIYVTDSTAASAPAGFSGGTFSSSNAGIASVSGATINGLAVGSSNISGAGWSHTNGATNCALAATSLTVASGNPPPPVCTGACGACNSSACSPTPSGGASYPACGLVRLVWLDNSTNETGFKIYRDGNLITTVATTNQAGTGGTMTYNYTTPDNNSYTYTVSSTNSYGDSSQVTITSVGGIASIPCAPNLISSDKDVVGINGKKIGTGLGNQCGGTDALPASVSLKDGDIIKFSINICNTGTLAASGITVTDTMVNLILPTTGWNAKFDDGTGEKPLSNFGITTNYSGNQLTFGNIPNVPVGTTRRLTFNAQLSKPAGFTGQSARFQNGFSITSNALTASGNTPLLPFYTGTGDSSIIEVP